MEMMKESAARSAGQAWEMIEWTTCSCLTCHASRMALLWDGEGVGVGDADREEAGEEVDEAEGVNSELSLDKSNAGGARMTASPATRGLAIIIDV